MTSSEARRHLETVKGILEKVERFDRLTASERSALQAEARKAITSFDRVIHFVRYAKTKTQPPM